MSVSRARRRRNRADAEFPAASAQAETKIATERLVNEEMKTRSELNEVFKQIQDLTLRSVGVTSAPVDPADVERELARVKRESRGNRVAQTRVSNDSSRSRTRERSTSTRALGCS